MAQQENRALGCDFREALGNQRKEEQKNHSTSVVKKIKAIREMILGEKKG